MPDGRVETGTRPCPRSQSGRAPGVGRSVPRVEEYLLLYRELVTAICPSHQVTASQTQFTHGPAARCTSTLATVYVVVLSLVLSAIIHSTGT
jgi:hypothetical protein